jgi:mRNA-degrading endonuclease RelE of RelBE toxin-antitoxin system
MTGIYQIEWKQSALRELKRLDRQSIPSIVKAIDSLASNPFPQSVNQQGWDMCILLRAFAPLR